MEKKLRENEFYAFVLKGKICVDRWGDAIMSKDESEPNRWEGAETLIQNGAKVKIVRAYIVWD